MQIINLSSTAKLGLNRLNDNIKIILNYIGLNRVPVMRCFLKNRHIPDSRHCHVERSRDRSCTERQHIDIRVLLLELFLLCNAETLFLIDYYQSEITEFNIL